MVFRVAVTENVKAPPVGVAEYVKCRVVPGGSAAVLVGSKAPTGVFREVSTCLT